MAEIDYYSNIKLYKPSRDYLKHINYYLDKYRFGEIYREFGFIDFLKIPAKELLKVLKNTKEDFNLRMERYDKFAFYATEHDWGYTFRNALGISNEDLLNLIIEYTNKVKGTKKYEVFAKILDSTCDIRYLDWLDKEKLDWHYAYVYDGNVEFVGDQKDIDHDSVSEFRIFVKNPIPLDIIRFMNSEVKMFKLKKESTLDSWRRLYNDIDKEYCQTEQGKKILSLAQGLLEKEETEEMEITL